MEQALIDLQEAQSKVLRCHAALIDWSGPAAKKLASVREYLESQSRPLEAALLADPLGVQ